ncbi:hypothetical protein JNB88_24580 [Rhizobium cauense]|uniref:hypothetical protein n=1 Tax=Rhizobium cauense TaxID=1166683 RepID=UPI001C6E22A2|nr:hypothetical protein [Rhizobium cauense]MBW9116812.1 hypothetical protein [Rhizobium cauense]
MRDANHTLTAAELIKISTESPAMDARQRRLIITRLVHALLEHVELLDDASSQSSGVAHLGKTLLIMADSVATADDITFSTVLLEAALLVRKLDAVTARRVPFLPN